MGKVVSAVAGIALAVGAVVLAAPTGGLSLALASAIGVSATVASAIIAVGVSFVGNLVLRALAGSPKAEKPAPLNFRQSIANSWIIIGKRRHGGLMVFFHPRRDGKTHYRYFVFASAGHRCRGVVRWWLGDEVVQVGANGAVQSGKYAGNAWLWFERGEADAQAHQTFVAECGGKWTTAHRGRGVAKIYAKFKMTDDVVQAGMPTISAEWEGSDEIVDPRTGAVGYTNLATPAFYWWLGLPREEGGFGAPAIEMPPQALMAAWTGVCAEQVSDGDGGTEARYAYDALIETGAAPSELRETFVTCCAGTFTYSSGQHRLRPGYWVPPTQTLAERDLSGPISLPMLREDSETATEVQATFVDPDLGYQGAPVPTRSVTAADIRQLSIDLPHIASHTRGQRIAEIMLQRAQCEREPTWPMNIAGLAVEAMETVQLGTPRHGLSNYAFVVDGWGMSSDYAVTLRLREENADVYAEPVLYAKSGGAELARADAINDDRAAHQILEGTQTIAYPVSSTADTVTLQAFEATIDTGARIAFPAATFDALEAATAYTITRSLVTGTYAIAANGSAEALAALASSDNVIVRYVSTLQADGTAPPTTTPPPGDGGGGYNGGGRNPDTQIP